MIEFFKKMFSKPDGSTSAGAAAVLRRAPAGAAASAAAPKPARPAARKRDALHLLCRDPGAVQRRDLFGGDDG